MGNDLYARSKGDGSPDWSDGTGYEVAWDHVADQLRFHKGERFKINAGPDRRFGELHDRVKTQLDMQSAGTVIRISSNKDRFTMLMRRSEQADNLKGERYISDLLTKTGAPYVFGAAGPNAFDCSGLTQWGLNRKGVEAIPHNAAAQHALFGNREGFLTIPQSALVTGDLIFIDQLHHVASYYGMYHGHPAVVDTEPHDTNAPAGWPSVMLGTGVRIRPMDGNYYCARIVSCGRIVEINGKP